MPSHTMTALYDTYAEAEAAVAKLEAAGVPHSDISLVSNKQPTVSGVDGDTAEHAGTGAGAGASLGTLLGGGAGLLAGLGLLAIPGIGPVVAAGWLVATLTGAGLGAAAGGLAGSLTGAGVSEADAHAYAEGIRRGGTLLSVRAREELLPRVSGILEEHGAVDLDARQQGWRQEGWTAPSSDNAAAMPARMDPQLATVAAAPAAGAYAAATTSTTGDTAPANSRAVLGAPTAPIAGSEARSATGVTEDLEARVGSAVETDAIPIVEERLNVGKRVVDQGRVRVHAYTVERPVNEQVSLRNETVSVDHRKVDRTPTSTDEALFAEKTLEAVERDEEAVVTKDARVVEEVGIRKDAVERTETVQDKLRHTEVEVEDERGGVNRISGAGTATGTGSSPVRKPV